jgi:hypothetical protein
MADQIRATPRNPFFGLFSDVVNAPLSYMSDPRRTQQMQGVASFLRSTGVPYTLENLSYDPSGRGLFTGAGGLGGTTRLRPEVAEAALTVAPFVGPAAQVGVRGAMATGRTLGPTAARMAEGYLQRQRLMPSVVPDGMGIKDAGSKFNVDSKDASEIFGAGAARVRYTEPNSGGSIEVLRKPDGSASVLSLEVPEKFRGQKIGESLQAQAMQDFPLLQGQVSSRAAAKTAYRLGRRPPGQPNASLDDVYKIMDEYSSVNLVSPTMQRQVFMPVQAPQAEAMRDVSYRGSHLAPNAANYGATIDDLGKIMPADVYSSKGISLYGSGDKQVDSEWFAAAYKAKGNPDKMIEIFRAVPKGVKDINEGDSVTTSRTYAKNHGEAALGGDYDIVSMKVKAKTLSSEGYPYEFGYNTVPVKPATPPTSPMYSDPFANTIDDTTR